MTPTKPYMFRKFFQEDGEIAKMRELGLTPTRIVSNDGAVPITGMDSDGERRVIAYVQPIAVRKRGTRYDAPDDERDELAQRIVDALNAFEPE